MREKGARELSGLEARRWETRRRAYGMYHSGDEEERERALIGLGKVGERFFMQGRWGREKKLW